MAEKKRHILLITSEYLLMNVRSVVGKVTTFGEEMKTFGTKISDDEPFPKTK